MARRARRPHAGDPRGDALAPPPLRGGAPTFPLLQELDLECNDHLGRDDRQIVPDVIRVIAAGTGPKLHTVRLASVHTAIVPGVWTALAALVPAHVRDFTLEGPMGTVVVLTR